MTQTDLHTRGLYIVLDPDGEPLTWTTATTGHGARATYLRQANHPWSKALAKGYRIVQLHIVDIEHKEHDHA